MRRNEIEALQRDCAEKDRLIFAQVDERRLLHKTIKLARALQAGEIAEMNRDIADYALMQERVGGAAWLAARTDAF